MVSTIPSSLGFGRYAAVEDEVRTIRLTVACCEAAFRRLTVAFMACGMVIFGSGFIDRSAACEMSGKSSFFLSLLHINSTHDVDNSCDFFDCPLPFNLTGEVRDNASFELAFAVFSVEELI